MPNRDERDLYNIVTVKNIDTEDFIFHVDSQPYMIPAGQTHNFPRFMARLAVKHLIDKVLNKEDDSGKLTANLEARQKKADQIVVSEQRHDKPIVPTDEQVVDDMNQPSDIDDVLARNKSRLKDNAPAQVPAPITEEQTLGEEEKEEFDGLKDEPVEEQKVEEKKEEASPKLPTREEMIAHAQNVMKMDVTDPKTTEAWDAMSDQELFDELQMGEI